MPRTAFLTEKAGGWWILRVPYNARFRDELVRTIPSSSRDYKPESKRWFVHEDCVPRVEAICRRHFNNVQVNRMQLTHQRGEVHG